MSKVTININRRKYTIDVDPQMPLLWVIRDYIGLTGTKYGCGIAVCGACTVHADRKPIRSCVQSVESVKNKKITTIEGISENNDHPVQQAWIHEQVPQCGYCHSGQIMAAVALLEGDSEPDEEKIQQAMDGILCRCGTYPRIKKALDRLIKDIEL
jgi:isoquinoline 1-oxidoreductase alpha subunit